MLREGIRVARCTVARLMAVMGLAGVLRGVKLRATVTWKAVAAGDRVNRLYRPGPILRTNVIPGTLSEWMRS
ncbi:hypothetical protein BGK51_16995 [Shigella sp. FC569]|nr:hypothetical protein BGK51_16995 [Shigella sp. FC569]OUK46680.1 hypothetical protein BZL31_26210 [Escherichia coli]